MAKQIACIVLILLVLALTLAGCSGKIKDTITAETHDADTNAEEIPVITTQEELDSMPVEECMQRIRMANPGMTKQQASDNCYTIEAKKLNDASLCQKVSGSFMPVCEGQFA